MEKFVTFGIIFLIIISFSACISQEKELTKESILKAIDGINAYTYEVNRVERRAGREYEIYLHEGIDRERKIFFAFINIRVKFEETSGRTRTWEYFDGSKLYARIEQKENGRMKNVTFSYTIDELYNLTHKYLKNVSREEYLKRVMNRRDFLISKLKVLLSKAEIKSIERDGKQYKVTFEVHNEYESVPNITISNANPTVIEDYKESMRSWIIEEMQGKLWVDNKGRPTKLEVENRRRITFKLANKTYEEFIQYNITFTYMFELPKWVNGIKEKS